MAGLNRFELPEAMAENLRKSKQQQILRVISLDFENFRHRRNLVQFEQMLKNFQPKREWVLEDRLYVEKLSQQSLRQVLNADRLFAPNFLHFYDHTYDQFLIALVYKNPPGRILRKQWKYQDKILPNLQYFLQK